MTQIFYVKTMDGLETILHQEHVFTMTEAKIDPFYIPHGVSVWATTMVEVSAGPWQFGAKLQEERQWYLYRHVKGIWMMKMPEEVPKILRMMELTGAL